MVSKEKKLIIYGAGCVGQQWVKTLGKENVYMVVDSNPNKWGELCGEIEIKPASLLKEIENIVIFPAVFAKEHMEQIVLAVKELGLEECIVGTPYYDKVYMGKNSIHDTDVEFEGANFVGDNVCLSKTKVGYASYIASDSNIIRCNIGRYSSIAPNFQIVYGQHPTHGFVSTHPIFYSIQNSVLANIRLTYVQQQLFEEQRYTPKGLSAEIGNDVWIGQNVAILEGIKVADGTIVAAGAVVTRDTLPYSIVGGVPAKIISYRFPKDDIDFLINLKWWEKDEAWIKSKAHLFRDINMLRKDLGV